MNKDIDNYKQVQCILIVNIFNNEFRKRSSSIIKKRNSQKCQSVPSAFSVYHLVLVYLRLGIL